MQYFNTNIQHKNIYSNGFQENYKSNKFAKSPFTNSVEKDIYITSEKKENNKNQKSKNIKTTLNKAVSEDGKTITYTSSGNGYDRAQYILTITIDTIQYDQAENVW